MVRPGACLCLLLAAAATVAHETDQYTVPLGQEFAELGPYFSKDFHDRIQSGVNKANARIRQAIERGASPERLAELQSAVTLVRAVHDEFPSFVSYIEDLDRLMHSGNTRNRYPGYVVAYRSRNSIYEECFPLDTRQFYKLWRSSTLMVNGVYFGTDKLGHLVHNGYFYYMAYDKALRSGASERDAVKAAVELGAGPSFFHSETRLLGRLTSGVISNADLASNYAGFKFFLNLATPTMVRGRLRPPMVRRDGEYWRVEDWVRPDSCFLTDLVSEHFDEVLNPNIYTFGLKTPVTSAIRKRCANLRRWYTDINGIPRSRRFYAAAQRRTETYYGEDYGYLPNDERCVSVVDVCFGEQRQREEREAASDMGESSLHHAVIAPHEGERHFTPRSELEATDALGRTPLHWAVRAGKVEAVAGLLAAGAEVNAVDIDGETPLHHAVRLGRRKIVQMLLENGSGPDAAARYRTRALHLAARGGRVAIVQSLVSHGASLDAADRFGCTALHDAAAMDECDAVRLLIAAGAHVNMLDGSFETPLQKAIRSGSRDVICLLLAHGAQSPEGIRVDELCRVE